MKIAFLSSPRPAAQCVLKELTGRYGQAAPLDAEFIVSVGGDGTVLKALQTGLPIPAKPIFAMRTEGSVGFLGNPLRLANLRERLRSAVAVTLHPLRADIEQTGKQCRTAFAINEIVVIRERLQTAKLRFEIQGQQAPTIITGDGLMLATPLGSTAYNRSLGGPLLPRTSSLLALTGIAIRHPADWSHLVLDDHSIVDIEVIEADHHPVRLETSTESVPNVRRVRLSLERSSSLTLLFDRDTPPSSGGHERFSPDLCG